MMSGGDGRVGGRRPVLLTGIPRSGTTWVGRILTVSGELGYINEPFNLSVSPGSFRVPAEHWYTYVSEENEGQFLPALARALAFEYPLARELRRCRNRVDLDHTLRSWRSFARSRGRRPLVKEPHAVFSAAWFARRLESDIVVMVRSPLAVVSSWKRLGWDVDFAHLLEQPLLMRDWLGPFESEMHAALSPSWQLIDRVALLWRVIYSVVSDHRFPKACLLRHEDLSRDPSDGYRMLYGALGLTFTPRVIDAVRASSSSENLSETTVEQPHETHLDSRSNLDNWRHRLERDEIARIRRTTEETAARYYSDLSWS
jgi:sulfotransferase family protein